MRSGRDVMRGNMGAPRKALRATASSVSPWFLPRAAKKMKLTSTEMGKSGGGAGSVVKIRSSDFEILGFTCSLDI